MFGNQLTIMDKKIMGAALVHFTENSFDDFDATTKKKYDGYAQSMIERLPTDTSDYLHNEVNMTALALSYFKEAVKFNQVPKAVIKEFPSKNFLINTITQIEDVLHDVLGIK